MVVSVRFHGRDSSRSKTKVSRQAHMGKRVRFFADLGELSGSTTTVYAFSTILESLFLGPLVLAAPQR